MSENDLQPPLFSPTFAQRNPSILAGAFTSCLMGGGDALPAHPLRSAIGLAARLAYNCKHAIDEGLAFNVRLQGPLVFPK
ncbi:hypothetical protein RAD10_39635 [Bradyrhizobium sp. 23AC]